MKKSQTKIDPFSQKRLGEIAERFKSGNSVLEKAASFARVGFLIAEFDDLDLLALSRAGLLTFGDIATLVRMGRLPSSEQPTY